MSLSPRDSRTAPWARAAVAAMALAGPSTTGTSRSAAHLENTQQATPSQSSPSGDFLTADLVNDESFETGWHRWTSWSYGTPTGVSRDSNRHYDGRFAIRKELPATTRDIGSQFGYSFARNGAESQDRVWVRFYFFLDPLIDGGIKFVRFFDGGLNTQFSGLGIQGGFINARFDPEAGPPPAHVPNQVNIVRLAGQTGGWHSIEVDYWRNGDRANSGNDYPSMAFWYDGKPITHQIGALPNRMAWINGRLNVGQRANSRKLGFVELLGLINGRPANRVPGNIWVDKVSISSKGRIGP